MKRLLTTLLVLGALLGFPGRAHAERLPITVDRGQIVVHAAAGLGAEAAGLADRAVDTLPAIAEDLQDLPGPRRIEIRLVHDSADLPSVAPPGRGAPRWAAGVAYPDAGVVAVAMRRGANVHDVVKTLDHELAHLALGAAIPDAPRWLHEGFAWQHATDLDLARAETLTGMAWFGGVIPMDELEAGFPAEELPASRAYAQSYDFVGFLAQRGRWADANDDGDRWPFRRFLRALAHGATVDDAALEAYGVPIDQLFLEWKADLVRRYLTVPSSVFASVLWIFAAVLLVIAYYRRRHRTRAQIARWSREEAAADRTREERDRRPLQPIVRLRVPPHVPWPGTTDPLDERTEREGDLEDLRTRYPDAVVGDGPGDDEPAEDGDEPAPKPPRWIN